MSKAQDALKVIEVVLEGVGVAQKLSKLGGKTAEVTLEAISDLLDVLQNGLDGKVSAYQVAEATAKLRRDLAGNDMKADSLVDEKFG